MPRGQGGGRPPRILAIGTVFAKLTVIGQAGKNTKGQLLWRCRCECGNEVVRTVGHLDRTSISSCGCAIPAILRANGAARRVHGHYSNAVAKEGGTPTYRSWQSMLQRCYYPNHIAYSQYGARAISVTKEWRDSFVVFLRDMGERPKNTSLDRIDRRFGYFPSNCRWATVQEQSHNRRGIEYRPAFMHPRLIDESDLRVAAYRIWR